MKTPDKLFVSKPLASKFNTYLAAVVTVGILTLGVGNVLTSSHANPSRECRDNRDLQELTKLLQKADVAELDQLLADFHGALSYGGNLTAMTSLWVENSSLTFNGAPNVGKAAVLSFFTSGGYFHNNWVSLAPEYKTMIKVHGDTADFTTQCVAIDLSVTPNVVKSVIQVTGTAVRVNGKWIFKSMNNTSPAPL
jgi:hypothetical protein